MKPRIWKFLFITSVIGNLIFAFFLMKKKSNTEPNFHPFEVNYNVTFKSLNNSGYKRILNDVTLLGKQLGDTLIYYQCEIHDKTVSFSNCLINIDKTDSISISSLLNKYDADIVSVFRGMEGDPYYGKTIFFARHRFSNEIFQCAIRKGYMTNPNDLSEEIETGRYELSIPSNFQNKYRTKYQY